MLANIALASWPIPYWEDEGHEEVEGRGLRLELTECDVQNREVRRVVLERIMRRVHLDGI